jgi:tRNA-binding EMAP/Myf-like protein
MAEISIDDFKKVEIRVGEILSAERIEGSDKLLKLRVNFGPAPEPVVAEPVAEGMPTHEGEVVAAAVETAPAGLGERQVLSGIAAYFPDPQVLVGKRYPFVTNLAPRKMMGMESQAMIMATGGGDQPLSLFPSDAAPGSIVR